MLLFCIWNFKWNKDLNEQWRWSPSTYLLFCKPPYGLASNSKPSLTVLSITPKISHPPPIFLGGGHHDNSISLCEEILNKMLQESILQPLIFSFHGWDVFLLPSAVAVNIVSPTAHIFGDMLVQYNNQIKAYPGNCHLLQSTKEKGTQT